MLPLILRKDIRLLTLSKLTTEEMDEIRAIIPQLNIMDIDNVHPSFLPWLWWWFRGDEWDDAWTEARKREVVKNALILFKFKGTVWAVQRALDLTGYASELTIWYQATPVGPKGTFTIDVWPGDPNAMFNQSDYDRVFRLVESNKQGSQTWVGTIKNTVNGEAYFACSVKTEVNITIGNKP
ncbi:phage tail protein I [Photobacterium damselae subsp. damselae]